MCVYILRAYVHVRPLARVSNTPVKREQIENIGPRVGRYRGIAR